MNIEDNQIDVSQINLRNKGLKQSNGKLIKGCVKDAFTKLSIGSIPSNFQSIIYHHQEKKGFGTSQKRFYQDPGPSEISKNQIDSQQTEEEEVKAHASYSTKGYGPLIAKEKRCWMKMSSSPGPGKYDLNSLIAKKQRQIKNKYRKCFSREKEDLKIKQIIENRKKPMTPAPGHYEVLNQQNKHKLEGWKSSFETKGSRETYVNKTCTPGPGCYNSLNNVKPTENLRELQQQEYFKKSPNKSSPKQNSGIPIPIARNPELPGPGAYEHDIPSFKPLYEKIKISSNFIQSKKDRFNNINDEINEKQNEISYPNSCTYNVKSSFDRIEPRLIDSAAFMSESKRIVFAECQKKLGPNIFYNGTKQIKKNFHFNIRGGWL